MMFLFFLILRVGKTYDFKVRKQMDLLGIASSKLRTNVGPTCNNVKWIKPYFYLS